MDIYQVDGDFTLNENICDIDGMNTAASAFEELYESAATMVPTGDLVYLPNNPYTPQQLFFINTAQVGSYIVNLNIAFVLQRSFKQIVMIPYYLSRLTAPMLDPYHTYYTLSLMSIHRIPRGNVNALMNMFLFNTQLYIGYSMG